LAGDAQVIGPADVRAAGCTSQWRHVRPGDVFVALIEADDDGHDWAHEAARRGATAIVCERALPVFDVPQFVVADSRTAYGRLCQAFVGNPSQQLKVIGAAGTAGKTTTARLLHSIFREAGASCATLDSFGYWDGANDAPAHEHDLSPPLLARSLAEMVVAGASHAIVEVSSRELCQGVLAGVTLDAVCITHIDRGDTAWHGSVEHYRQAERRIFAHSCPEAAVVLNADDPFSMRVLSELNQPALTYGLKQPSEITAEIIEQYVNEQTFVLTAGDESVGVRTAIIGDHHVYNCLAAAATCLTYGIELTTIARGLEAVDQLPGRMERIMCGQSYSVIVDAARSPDSLRACLRAARKVTRGRVICVFGQHVAASLRDSNSAVSESLPYASALGRVAGTMADLPILTSACEEGTAPKGILAEVRRGFTAPEKARVIANRIEAIAFALRDAQEGDTVVVAGMGNRHYTADQTGMYWNDREVVQNLLCGPVGVVAKPRLAA
jgi:UDP-N-acetylmuramoyl-L-alanyl-D-glutamate--2,6-diaminopimelate ligase